MGAVALEMDLKSMTTSVQTPSFIIITFPRLAEAIAKLSSTELETKISLSRDLTLCTRFIDLQLEEKTKQLNKSPMQGIKIYLFFIFCCCK
jgi:hypothetical protein